MTSAVTPSAGQGLPTGTVTFLFTDIEGSTALAQQFPAELPALLARHHAILHQAIQANNGYVFQITGDAFCAAFYTASDALKAALDAQRALQHEAWYPAPLKVRMGLHSGSAQAGVTEERAGGYVGYLTLTRVQRVMSVAHGGQVLLSNSTAELVRGELPADVSLRDMNEHRLKGLSHTEHLWQLIAPGVATVFPPLQSLTTAPNNLPLQLTSFIGRKKEMSEIKALLSSSRLVTLTGSGGTGKTRLCVEMGTEELAAFRHGVWLIELAPLSDAAQITPAMAQVFGLHELPFNPLANLVLDYLRDKEILLLLDNCEHLVEACARLADDLLHHCAGLKILATSREALGIAGEAAYRVPSLLDSESTQLFVERARALNPNFQLTDSNVSAVAQICRRLGGIPLALELAAARANLLTAEQIAARLDDRFRLLVDGSRTALPRQQTLRALIDWSYDLLTDEEKCLLQLASVFVGGWTLDALEVVADDRDTLIHLDQLVNKSLVVTEERGSEMRYSMLETIRQYAREKLLEAQQASAARDRHFVYFDELSEKMWDMFRSSDVLPLVNRAEIEVDNFRAALEWGLENRIEGTVRLAANFCVVSSMLGILAEGVAIASSAVERARALPPVEREANIRRQKFIARALFAQGMVGLQSGKLPMAMQALKEAISISRVTCDKRMLGYSLEMYSVASTFANAPTEAGAVQEGLKIFSHEIDDRFGLGMAYMNAARLAAIQGDDDEQQMYFGKLWEITREMPGSFPVGMFLLGMGMDARLRGSYETSRKILEEGLDIFKHIRNTHFKLILMSELGHTERHMGHLTKARLIYQETIRGWQNLGNRSALARELECFGFLAIAAEDPQRAIKLYSAAEALHEETQSPMTAWERLEHDQSIARLHSMLDEAEFNLLWAEGRVMTTEEAVLYALETKDA